MRLISYVDSGTSVCVLIIGAFLYAWKPKIVHLLKWYYVIRLFKRTELSVPQIVEQLNRGIEGYKNKEIYKE